MKALILGLILMASFSTMAGDVSLTNLTDTEVENITDEFASNFLFTSVSPAHSLGKIWGIEVGAIAGITPVPATEELVKRADPTLDEFSFIGHAGAFAAVTIPFGITFEASLLPELEVAGVNIDSVGGAVKWTVTDVFFSSLPVNIAVKGHFSSSSLSYQQQIAVGPTSVATDVEFENTIVGGSIMVDYDILFLEPYAGIGFASHSSDITLTAASSLASIFSDASQAKSSSSSSAHMFAGLQFDLWLMHIAAEYSNAWSTDRVSAKVSLYF